MMFKAVLVVCAQALFVQSIVGQCIGAGLGISPYAAQVPFAAANYASLAAGPCSAAGPFAAVGPFAAAGPFAAVGPFAAAGPFAAPWSGAGSPFFGNGYGPAAVPASHGGAMPVSSASAIPASGVSVWSENAIEGTLAVSGALPFLGTVALEGALPTAGAGAVAYGCGNGEVAMLSEDIGVAGYNGLAGPLGYGAGAVGYAAGPFGWNAGPTFPRAGCGCGSRLF